MIEPGGLRGFLDAKTAKPLNVTAIIATYNEADIIAYTVGDLVSQRILVHLIDTGSTDATVREARRFLGRGLLHIEELPLVEYAHARLMKRKEALASELDSDWFISADADEFRESPWTGVSLLDGIRRVDALGYNAIDFAVLDFVPTHDDLGPGDDPREAFPYFEPSGFFNKLQIRCWKKTDGPVELASSGGHEAVFPGRKVFPIRFILRHYPFRGQAHGERKLFQERRLRYPEEEKRIGWHVQYDGISEGHRFIRGVEDLDWFDPERIRIALQINNRELEALKANLESVITNNDVHIDNLETAIRDKEGKIGNLESVITNNDVHIDNLETAIRDKDAHVGNLNQAIAERDGQIAQIISSYSWRITLPLRVGLGKYQKTVEKLLPSMTQRRYYYELVLSGIRIIFSEGWQSFFRQAKDRLGYSKSPSKRRNVLTSSPVAWLSRKEEELIFPNTSQPEVSIVIPVHNKWKYTIQCLSSLYENTTGNYEVIIVDDASTDETAGMLSKVRNLRLVRNTENAGFIDSCNRGAALSKGDYILFLNNDTMVNNDWLPPLLEMIRKKGVGAVGSKLIYPDGTLQEAGAIIWSDGSGWNYGRSDADDKPEYNYVREVDYCSGACLLVKRKLFEEVGGFDNRFKPAYYEDTDLCFSLRNIGYQILYQPKSIVTHFEGVTSGTEISGNVKKNQEINKLKFVEKWTGILQKAHYKPSPNNVLWARDRRLGERILVIDHYVPTYDRDSGSMRMFNILGILSELGHKVTFIGDNMLRTELYTQELQQKGIEVIYAPHILSVKNYIKAFGKYFTVVMLSRSHIAIKYINLVKSVCPTALIIYDTVDLSSIRETRRGLVENSKKAFIEAENCKRTELYLVKNSDITFVVSPEEKAVLLKEDSFLNIEIVSNIHRITKPQTPFSDRKDVLFVGGFDHPPNTDAVVFFINEVFPLIKRRLPSLRVYIVGNNPTKQVAELKSEDIIVTGYVTDLAPYFEKCRVFVAPLRYGAGVKGKINQSMSHGLPVVTTSIGAEGIGLVDGVDALIADEPDDFAEKVAMIHENEELWNELSTNSIENIRTHFSPEVAREKLKALMDVVANKERYH